MEPDAVGDQPAGGATKLDAAAAIAIFLARRQQRDGTTAALAKQYNITMKAVRDVWNRRTWRETTRPYWTRDDERKYYEKVRCSRCKSDGVTSQASACAACAAPRRRGRPARSELAMSRNNDEYSARKDGLVARPLCSMYADSPTPWDQQGSISVSGADNIPAHSISQSEISGDVQMVLPSYHVRDEGQFPFPNYEAHFAWMDGHAASPAAARQDRCGSRFDEGDEAPGEIDYAAAGDEALTFLRRDSSWPLDGECQVRGIDTATTPARVSRSELAHAVTDPGPCASLDHLNLPLSRPGWQLHAIWLEPGEQLKTEPEFDAVLAYLAGMPMPALV